jgi:hypothetical protein
MSIFNGIIALVYRQNHFVKRPTSLMSLSHDPERLATQT